MWQGFKGAKNYFTLNKKPTPSEDTVTCKLCGAILDTIGFLILIGVLFALVCYAAPDQLSAEADMTAQTIKDNEEHEASKLTTEGLAFVGAKMKEEGNKVFITLAFERKDGEE